MVALSPRVPPLQPIAELGALWRPAGAFPRLAEIGFPWQSSFVCYTLCGIAGVGLFFLFAMFAGRRTSKRSLRRRWRGLIEGRDGRLSISKTQWFMWLAVLAGTYAAVFDARSHAGVGPVEPGIPINVLIALGLSTITMILSEALAPTSAAGARGELHAPDVAPGGDGQQRGGLFDDERGRTDLAKVQLMTWTVLALSIYVYSLAQTIGALAGHLKDAGIPDLDPPLLVLTGLSQAGYLGTRLVLRFRP